MMRKLPAWLRGSILLVTFAAASTFLLVVAGVFDPKPLGEEVWRWKGSRFPISAGESAISWLANPRPSADFSIRLTAALVDGELDAAWGVVVGDEESHTTVALSPLGYAAVWQEAAGAKHFDFPWQPWPHVRSAPEENEIWLDFDKTGTVHLLTVWINRELMWRETVEVHNVRIGLFAESYGRESRFDFREIILYGGSGE